MSKEIVKAQTQALGKPASKDVLATLPTDEYGIIHHEGRRYVKTVTGELIHLPKTHPQNVNPFAPDYVIQEPFTLKPYETKGGKIAHKKYDANGVRINKYNELDTTYYQTAERLDIIWSNIHKRGVKNKGGIPKKAESTLARERQITFKLFAAELMQEDCYKDWFDVKGRLKTQYATPFVKLLIESYFASPLFVAKAMDALREKSGEDAIEFFQKWTERIPQKVQIITDNVQVNEFENMIVGDASERKALPSVEYIEGEIVEQSTQENKPTDSDSGRAGQSE